MEAATKFGYHIIDAANFEIRGDPTYVRVACEGSLKRLNIDCIDLYYQHRVDVRLPIEVTVSCQPYLILLLPTPRSDRMRSPIGSGPIFN